MILGAMQQGQQQGGSGVSGLLPPVATLPGVGGYKVLKDRQAEQLQSFAKHPMIQREAEEFRAKASSIQSVDDLMKDYKAYKMVLTAYGMEDQQNANALMRRVMEEGTLDPQALANQMNDRRYAEMSRELGFGEGASGNFSDPEFVESTIDRFIVQRFEESVGESNPAARRALYFERTIGKVDNWFQVMSDRPLFDVIRGALGLPEEIGQLDIDRQRDMLESRMPLKELKENPEKIQETIQRFMALEGSGPNQMPSTPATQLITGATSPNGLLDPFAMTELMVNASNTAMRR